MKFTTFYGFRRTCAAALATLLAAAMLCCSAIPRATAGKPVPTAGRTIFFESRTHYGYNLRLQLMRDDGTGVVTIDNSSTLWPSSRARWSPDGTMLGCYFKTLKDDFSLMAMKADGSQERVVVSNSQFNAYNLSRPGILDSGLNRSGVSYPCWLGNGAMVFPAYSEYDPSIFGYKARGNRLFIADAEGNILPLIEAPPLALANYDDADPHWSPALDAIVFVSDRSGFAELYAIRPDGTGLTQITDFRSSFYLIGPAWSPQGDRIALEAVLAEYGDALIILDVDLSQPNPGMGPGGRVTDLDPFKVEPSAYRDSPSWSPAGDRLLYRRVVANQFSQIVIADVATGAETVIAETESKSGTFRPRHPDWKPVP